MVFREGEESRIKMVFVVLITCGVDIFHFSCQIIIPRNWISIKLICIKVVNNFERNWVFYISLIGLLMISRAKFNYKALLILLIYIIDLVSVQHGKAPSSQLRGANRTFTPFYPLKRATCLQKIYWIGFGDMGYNLLVNHCYTFTFVHISCTLFWLCSHSCHNFN